MAKFLLEINLGNDAMKTNFDVGSKLMGIGNKITYGGIDYIENLQGDVIKDINGNTVGFYKVVP